jgi:hypothetical protein
MSNDMKSNTGDTNETTALGPSVDLDGDELVQSVDSLVENLVSQSPAHASDSAMHLEGTPTDELDDDLGEIDEETAIAWRLPFAFAKRFGVLLAKDDERYVLHCLATITTETILEVRRIIKAPFSFKVEDIAAFELLLTKAYQRDSSEAQQMMEDIGNEVDLYPCG